MPTDFIQAAQIGANLVNQGFERQLRAQQQKALEADRMVRERLITQQISDLQRKSDEAIAQEAATKSAMSKAMIELAQPDFLDLPPGYQGPPTPNTSKGSPQDILLKHLLPLSKSPEEAAKIVSDVTKLSASDPESFQNQIRLGNLQARQQGLGIAQGNLIERREGTELRRNTAIQGAVTKEAELTDKGLAPTVPMMPPGAPGPQGAAVGQPLVQESPRRLTPAAVTNVEKSVRDVSNSLAAVERAYQSVESTPEAFGPLGGVREALEVARSLVNPGQPTPVSGARATADAAAEDIIRGLKQDSQMSLFEKRQLDRLARITGAWTTPDVAKARLNVIKVGLASKAIRDIQSLGSTPPRWAQNALKSAQNVNDNLADLSSYTDDELAEAAKQGYISKEAALKEFRRRRAK